MEGTNVALIVGGIIVVAMEVLKRVKLVGCSPAVVKQIMVVGLAVMGVLAAHNWVADSGTWREVVGAALTAMMGHQVIVKPNEKEATEPCEDK